MNFALNFRMNLAVDVPFIYVILCKKWHSKECVIVSHRSKQKFMSDPKPSKKIVQDWVKVHDDFEDEPIVRNLPKEQATGAMNPKRRIMRPWDNDPDEAMQDPNYWINL
jgi:hypothetical protein